jgi:hypothetical protein
MSNDLPHYTLPCCRTHRRDELKHRTKQYICIGKWSLWWCMEGWRYSSNILDLVTRWIWALSFTQQPLYPRDSFLVSCGGVWMSPLGTSATNWSIVPAPGDRWWMWSSRWNEDWQGKPKYSEKPSPSATLSTTNPTWPDRGSNPGRRGG